MKLLLFMCFLFFSGICRMWGQFSAEQQILCEVNPHWAQVPLNDDQGMQVRMSGTYHERIQLHLAIVTDILHDRTASMDLDEPTRKNRLALLDTLKTYHERSVFPINNKAPYSTPVFVDDVGTHCAVGYLLHASGQDEVISHIVKENNLGYVKDLQLQYPELGTWARQNGFTIQELAWIQPLYQFFCNPQITRGEIIHNTCHGICEGAFYADHTTIELPPDVYLGWGATYKWQNGSWVVISHPDCLCPGTYRQGFDVYSMEGDSLYTEFVEAVILGPEELLGYWRDHGEAGLCRAYIEPDPRGGVPPYSFEVYDLEGNELNLGPLCQGEYYLITEDANGCRAEEMVALYSPDLDCLAFSVTGIQLNHQDQGYLNVTIFLEGDSTSFITIPYYAEIKNQNDDILAWSADTLSQYGGTSQTYSFETTSVPFPTNSTLTLELGFYYSFCQMPYYYTTTTTGELEEFSLSLYPNPLRSEATLMMDEVLSSTRLQIFNAHGQLIRTWTSDKNDGMTIERGNLPQGLYTLQVLSAGKTGVERFVIVD